MAIKKKVVRVEMRTEIDENIETKRHEYARGGFKIEEKIYRVTTTRPAALLECGHWVQERSSGASVATAKRLGCYQCENLEWMRKNETS
jgi:hypothetical protein